MHCARCGGDILPEHRFCPECAEPVSRPGAEEDPLLGRVIGGAYRVGRLLGIGGMGRVYEAEQVALGRSVAIKFVHAHHLGDEIAAARFHAEARAASRLNHPNSVAVLDFGRTENGQHYLVMEYLRGHDLACEIAEHGPLAPVRVAEIGRQVCAALAAAHDIGIVHRDVKPDNILLEPLRHGTDLVKVLDFGLATTTTTTRVGGRITAAGLVCGTPEYMSPEQCASDSLDGRSDLYSLGVVLYEAMTGLLPFDGESARLLSRHLLEPPVPPRWRVPGRRLPGALEDITLRALAKRPADRYDSADEMAEALEGYLTAERLGQSGRVCTSCGYVGPVAGRYCAVCGARHPSGATHVTMETIAHADGTATLGDERILGRDEVLAQMVRVRRDADRRGASVLVVAEAGVGARTLVREMTLQAHERGDLIARTGPEAAGASVPFGAARSLLAALLGVDAESPEALAREKASALGLDGEVALGITETFSADGAPDLDPAARLRAVGAALRQTAERACRDRRVLAVVERLARCDSPSRQALRLLARPPLPAGLLLVGMHTPGYEAGWAWAHRIDLEGLAAAQARILLARRANGTDPPIEIPEEVAATDEIPPLYVEELVRFAHEGGSSAPHTLVDLVAARVGLLPPDARRVLQAAAILGETMAQPDLAWMIDDGSPDVSLDVLEERGFVVSEGDTLRFAHPLVAEVVASGIPACARAQLHRRALDLRSRQGAPPAVRAHHALQAEGGFLPLLQLDLAGEAAFRRGDLESAIACFRRGIEIARHALSGSELYDPVRANVLFHRKLGRALVAAGDRRLAAAVLREGLALCLGGKAERAELLECLDDIIGGGREPAGETKAG